MKQNGTIPIANGRSCAGRAFTLRNQNHPGFVRRSYNHDRAVMHE